MTTIIDENDNTVARIDDAEFAEHMGDDCRPRALTVNEIDIDDLLEDERNLQDRKRAVAKELRERAWQLRENADTQAKVLFGKADDLEAKANQLDPPDDLGKCAGGAQRKPVVRKSRRAAKVHEKPAQRRAKAAKPSKAPRAQAKRGKPAAGGSGGKAKASNGAAKPARKPPPTGIAPKEADVLAQIKANPGYSGAEHARDNGWNGSMTSAVLRTLEASGKVRHEGEKRGCKWYPV